MFIACLWIFIHNQAKWYGSLDVESILYIYFPIYIYIFFGEAKRHKAELKVSNKNHSCIHEETDV